MKSRKAENHGRGPAVSPFSMARRDFFKTVGCGITIFFTFDISDLVSQESRGRGYPTDLNAYLKIGEDGRVTLFSGKIEMGQGVVTSLAQMAADELGVAIESVDMIMGDTDQCPFDMGTYGSLSTRFFGPPLRAAAAEARAILLDLAAEQLNTSRETLKVESGTIFTADKKTKVTFGQLAKGQKITRKASGKPKLKSPAEFEIMGKPIHRLDGVAKVTGKALYAGDIRLPDLMYAKILRPPAHGSKLIKADSTAAAKIPGTIVVDQDGMVAVLHRDPEIAEKALGAIQAEFDKPKPAVDDRSIFDYLVRVAPAPQEREKKGDLAQGEKAAASVLEAKYFNGYGAHAAMETHTACARVEGGKATVWISTQTPFPNQQTLAQALGFPPQNVRVITPFVGGGFGGKSNAILMAIEAAKLSKITGKPVQVAWSRAETFFYDTFRPAAVVAIKSGFDSAGRICLWDYSVYFAGPRSAEQFYDVPNNIIRAYGNWAGETAKAHLFSVGPWRAPGANINVFARESQIDMMASKAKVDPLEFRLKNTSDPRMRKVLEVAAEKFGYKPAAGPSGRGIGVACGIDAGTYCAEIAQIDLDRKTGKIKVRRIVCAQDMGVVINPVGATMQMEGCITMGLGYTLSEEVRFKGGEILEKNFDTYEIPHFSWLPKIETILVKNDELAPQGGGEPAIVPVGAVVANAIFDAAGVRLFEMPMTPARVKAAIDKKS